MSDFEVMAERVLDHKLLTVEIIAEALKQAWGAGYKKRMEDEEVLKRISGKKDG